MSPDVTARDLEWLSSQIEAGSLPDVMYGWTPLSAAVREEAAGRLIIVCWSSPRDGRQYWITKKNPSSLLSEHSGTRQLAMSNSGQWQWLAVNPFTSAGPPLHPRVSWPLILQEDMVGRAGHTDEDAGRLRWVRHGATLAVEPWDPLDAAARIPAHLARRVKDPRP